MLRRSCDVRFVPKADIGQLLFDYLVGALLKLG